MKRKRFTEEQIAPHLSVQYANLVLFPEYTAFTCCFSGSKGSIARQMNNAVAAFAMLGLSYARPMLHYMFAYPDISIQRALFLSLTDAIWRPFHETFSAIGQDYGVYILATAVTSDATVSTDPKDIEIFGDPFFPKRDYVYLPENENIYNQGMLYGPDGQILLRARKVHLIPDFEIQLLDIAPGSVDDLSIYDLYGARIGVVVCWDSWFDDTLSRLAALGANMLIVPTANPKIWGGTDASWEPEAWYDGPLGAVQSYPEFLFGAHPMLTGNFFDYPFDGQSSILSSKIDGAGRGYVGTEYREGFRELANWVIPDPCTGTPDPVCRSAIEEQAVKLLPGGADENGYIETVLYADIYFD